MGFSTAAVLGGSLIGGLFSASEGNKGRNAANQASNNALAQFDGIDIPNISDQELSLLIPQLVGSYDPEVMRAMNLDPSDMENISVDQSLKDQQMKSLQGLGEVADGGLTQADLAASRDIQREIGQNNQARQEAILANMAQRGVLGSGMELAAKMKANQMASDQQSKAGDQLIQQAQARALQAMTQAGNMAGQVRGQDFGEKSQVAQARDAINQFNVQNRQSVGNQNVQQANEAQRLNLAARQAQAEQAAAIKNQQQMHNKGLLQQQFNNQKSIADSKAGIYQNAGAQQQAGHAQTGAAIGQAVNAIGSGIASIYGDKK